MLTRNEAINEVLALYDEMDMMGNELLDLKYKSEGERRSAAAASECAGGEPDQMTAKLCEFARSELIDKVLYGWKEVRAKRGEQGEVVYSPSKFDGWFSAKVQRDKLPSWMSYDEFVLACEGELRERYALERKAALDRLLEEEAEKKKEEEEAEEGGCDD